jgi:F-type H+-transporting ATPase subunit a
MGQQHHELWITELFNHYLAAPANAVLSAVGLPTHDRPWENFMVMQILVAVLLIIGAALLRAILSVQRPGTIQQLFETIYEFLKGQTEEVIGHDGPKFLPFAGTMFLFIVVGNLIGIIPGFESPTMFVYVPCGCALATFAYYNLHGLREQGVVKYLAHFAGPVAWLAPLMFPIEIISHLARPLSLTVRLYANMFAGEMVTLVFLGMVPLAIPAIFMGLHVFVGLLQAYIFTVLTLIYISGAVAHEEH